MTAAYSRIREPATQPGGLHPPFFPGWPGSQYYNASFAHPRVKHHKDTEDTEKERERNASAGSLRRAAANSEAACRPILNSAAKSRKLL